MISLSATIAAHGAHTMERAREIRRDAFIKTGQEIIDGTPIKTGWARGNWQTSVGEAMTNVLPVRPASEAKTELAAIADEAATVEAKADPVALVARRFAKAIGAVD